MSSTTTTATSAKPGQFTAMISSTAVDLPAHRAAVKEACLAAGVFPIGMEHLPTRDATGVTVSLEMVDKADIYIGIYAFRYGWVPEGGDVSITEMEFNHALQRKKDGHLHELLIFIAHKDHLFTQIDIEADATAQKRLAAFKARACDGRGRAQFSSVEELRRQVSDALHHFQDRRRAAKDAATAPATAASALAAQQLLTSTRHNLPRLTSFFGRAKELEIIAKALLPETRTWGVLIDGPGGMGKTSLAVRAAELATPQFDRVLFLTTKSRRLTPEGAVDITGSIVPAYPDLLSQMGRLLGRPHVIEKAEVERAVLIKAALQTEKVLLILDNLENLSKDQQNLLFEFLQNLPQSCKAIVTSRRRSDVEARIIRLEKLDQEAALEFLEELATDRKLLQKATPEQRLHLYEETGGNPLLLRWIVGQLGRESCRSIESALARCRQAGTSNDPLEFIFGDLLDTFTEAETKALAALTYFTQKVEVQHIAELAGLTKTATQTALANLANRALVIPDEEEQNFVLVPMVADFLRQKRPQVVAETGDRLERRAYALIVENGLNKYDRFPLLEAAWPGVAPAIPCFLTGPNERLQEVGRVIFDFLHFTGRWDECLALNEQAEALAVAAGDAENAGWRAYHTGMIHYRRGQADTVLECAGRAKAHWAQAFPASASRTDAAIRASAFANRLRGIGHEMRKEYPAAIAAFREGLEQHRSLSAESVDVAMALNDLAESERYSGDSAAAEREYREALRVARAVGYVEGIAIYTGNLAELAQQEQDWPKADALARECMSLAEKVGRQELIAWICASLAETLVRQGKSAEGLTHARRAVDIFTRLGSHELAGAQATLAGCEAAMAEAEAAKG